jgi:hypothetical protein
MVTVCVWCVCGVCVCGMCGVRCVWCVWCLCGVCVVFVCVVCVWCVYVVCVCVWCVCGVCVWYVCVWCLWMHCGFAARSGREVCLCLCLIYLKQGPRDATDTSLAVRFTTRNTTDTHEADTLGRNLYAFFTAGPNSYVPAGTVVLNPAGITGVCRL